MEYIYEHYVKPSAGLSGEEDYMDETTMMQTMLADTERACSQFQGINQGSSSAQPQQGAQPFDADGQLLFPSCPKH